MTDLREAAQQALEALESAVEYDYHGTPLTETHAGFNDAATALRAALAEPEYPLGQATTDVGVPVYVVKKSEPVQQGCDHCNQPLYAAVKCRVCGRVNQAEPMQEPVAWMHTDPDKPRVRFLEWREVEPGYRGRWIKTPLYTAPLGCPNCASLQAQNTELDRKLAELEGRP